MPCERLATVLRQVRESTRKTVANSSHPSETGVLTFGHGCLNKSNTVAFLYGFTHSITNMKPLRNQF